MKKTFSEITIEDSDFFLYYYEKEVNTLILFLKAGIYNKYPIQKKMDIRIGFETSYGKHIIDEAYNYFNVNKPDEGDKLSTKSSPENFYWNNSIDLQYVYITEKNIRWILSCKNTLVTRKIFSNDETDSILNESKLLLSPQLIVQFPL